MANVPSLEISQTSEEGLAPSSLLEQSLEDLASEMCFPSLSHLSHTEVEEAVPWPDLWPSATCKETLADLMAACFPEFFQPSDQTRHIKPVNTSDFNSRHQEAKHGLVQSMPTSPSIRDLHPCLPKHPSEIFPAPHQPYVTYHLTPHCPALVLDVTRANTPHFFCVPQPNHTSAQLNINYTPLGANHCCPMHGAILPHPFSPSCVLPSHLCVLNSNPAVHRPTSAERPSESLDRDQSWRTHVMTSSASLHENFSVWQRLCEKAKEFYSKSPHVQALTCFFMHEIDSLTVPHSGSRFDAAVNMAVQKWDRTSMSEREKYYTSAKMFIKLGEEERRFIQHRIKTNNPRGQHSGLWENPEVKDRSEVGREIETMNMSSLFSKRQNTAREREKVRQVTANVPDGEKILKRVKRKPEPNKRTRRTPRVSVMDPDVLPAESFTNRTDAHQTARTRQQQVTCDRRHTNIRDVPMKK